MANMKMKLGAATRVWLLVGGTAVFGGATWFVVGQRDSSEPVAAISEGETVEENADSSADAAGDSLADAVADSSAESTGDSSADSGADSSAGSTGDSSADSVADSSAGATDGQADEEIAVALLTGLTENPAPDEKEVVPNAPRPTGLDALEIDVVRIDRYGSTVVAGRAEPDALIRVLLGAEILAEQRADARGQFAIVTEIGDVVKPTEIRIALVHESGRVELSRDTVIVLPAEFVRAVAENDRGDGDVSAVASRIDATEESAGGQPTVLIASDDGARLMQPALPVVDGKVLVELVSYDERGEAIIAGRAGSSGKTVRIYVDNKLVKEVGVGEDGSWRADLSGVDPGRYTLRVDEIDAAGDVAGRVEMPFQKEGADFAKSALSAADGRAEGEPLLEVFTVQRGHTLWGISRDRYGLGRLFVNIFDQNDAQITDPHLIYPGQIFRIPHRSELVDPEGG